MTQKLKCYAFTKKKVWYDRLLSLGYETGINIVFGYRVTIILPHLAEDVNFVFYGNKFVGGVQSSLGNNTIK